jgi:type IV secretion system protein TrbH
VVGFGSDNRYSRTQIRAAILALPVLLGACAPSWPSGSYVAVTQDDAAVLAPAIANYVAGAVSAGDPVVIVQARSDDLIAPLLASALDREGVPRSADGHLVQYVAGPMDSGVLLRVSIDGREGGSRYFSRTNGTISPAGPMMVALP